MKRYLLLTILVCFATFVSAQTYQLLNNGQDMSGKDISLDFSKLDLYGDDTQPKVPAFILEIKNVSSANVGKTRVDFSESVLGEGVGIQACETSCFIYDKFTLDPIAPNAKRKISFQFSFTGEFKETTLKVKVFNPDTPDQVQSFSVKVTSGGTSIQTEKFDNTLDIFPNPANDNFTINHNYGSNAQIAIFDMLGKKIDVPVYNNGSSIKINSSSWDSGYYFCRLFKDGKIEKTIKIVVSH